MTLNDAQRQLVESEEKLIVGVAGPGSGKTRTLIERIRRRSGWSVMVVLTYTNAAAHEMRKRLGPDVQLSFLGTLHSYCFRLIQRHAQHIGYKPGTVAILPKEEKLPRLIAIAASLGLKLTQREIQAHNTEPARMVWREYEFILKRNNLVDYDTILREAAVLLHKPEVLELIKVDDLLVEEAQDSAMIDWLIYTLIPADTKFYVGDPDQSIFAFRGSFPRRFVTLCQQREATVVPLELNYRSDVLIANAANNLIAHNTTRVPKLIKPVSTENGDVFAMNLENESEELGEIATRCRKSLSAGRSVALLCRRNHEARRYATALQGFALPIIMPHGQTMRPADLNRAMLLLSLVVSPANEILIERYLKLDNPAAIVDRWKLEGQAGGKSFVSRTPVVSTPAIPYDRDREILRFLAENRVGEVTIDYIKQRMALIEPDATLADLLHDLYAHEEMKREEPENGIYVGTMHCSPGDELVRTTTGWKQLDQLVSSDRLFSYVVKCNQLMRGKNSRGGHAGYRFTRKWRHYVGPMLTVTTAESKTRVTPEHRMRVRFTDAFKEKWVVYLMRRGNWWRIGITQSCHAPYRSGGVGGRLATEKADCAWILRICTTRQEALLLEQIYQTAYQLPGLRFEHTHRNDSYTSDELHAVHKELEPFSEGGAKKLLRDKGLLSDSPLYRRGGQRVAHHGAWFETVAANLVAEYMAVPIAIDEDWHRSAPTHPRPMRIDTIQVSPFIGRVYSLDVQPHQFYASGGAIVHNSAKGREWDVVFLPAFEEGIIPHLASNAEIRQRGVGSTVDEIEEERRLAFVAVTRARHELFITHVATRTMQWTGPQAMQPSRFIQEMRTP